MRREQKDPQSATDQTDLIDDAADDDTDRASEDDYSVDMDQVEAVLNATADKNMMTLQMQRRWLVRAESPAWKSPLWAPSRIRAGSFPCSVC